MALNFRKFVPGINIVPKVSSTVSVQGDLDVDSTSTKLNYHNGTTSSHVVTETQASQGASRLQNKDFDASNTDFADPTDTTKQIKFQVSGATTGFSTTLAGVQTANRVLTLPDVTDTLATLGGQGTLTNKLLDEASVWFVDHSDNTKTFKFDVSGATSGFSTTLKGNQTANQVLTLPNSTDTLVGRNTTDTLTNKTLTSPILNTPTADTITGIAGGSIQIKAATGQDAIVQAPTGNVAISSGTGQVSIQNINVLTNTIQGPATADLSIQTQTNKNIQLSPNGTGTIIANKPLEFVQFLQTDRTDDATTTGTATTLTAFTTSFVKVTNGSLVSLSAIPAGTNGQQLILSNGIGTSFVINNEDTGVTAANRILTGTNAPLTVNNNSSTSLIYDTGASRWKVFGGAGGGSVPTLFGSRGTPRNIVAGTGITAGAGHMSTTATSQAIFIQGNGGPVIITASPAIQAGTIIGQQMLLIGRSNTNTVEIDNSSGQVELNGNIILGLGDTLSLFWDGTAWTETGRN